MKNIFDQIMKSAVDKVLIVVFALIAIMLPSDKRVAILKKASEFLLVIPSPIYVLMFMALLITYVVHVYHLKSELKLLKPNKIIPMLGLKWLIDYGSRAVFDPLCPTCENALTGFYENVWNVSGKEVRATVMRCGRCHLNRVDNLYPTSDAGQPLKLLDAKEIIRKILFSK